VTRGWFAVTESPSATSTVLTAPRVEKASSTFCIGTTIAEADALPDEEEVCEAESSDTVGMAVGVADEPQAVSTSANVVVNIQNTFFIN
jgi:hypothetical protein